MIDWHRLFGIILTDFFTDSPFTVEVEKDLSAQQQKLDVIVIRKHPGPFNEPLPDGFGELANHNLLTFKSHQEALTVWTLQELLGHYVSYRKLVSPSTDDLLPEEHFRLLALCARYPQQLASKIELQEVSPGVYDYQCAGISIRIIVAHQLPQAEQNVLFHLFSALPAQVQYAAEHYQQRSPRTSTVLSKLLTRYREEGVSMSYTMEDFMRDVKKELLDELTPQERKEVLDKLTPQEKKELLDRLTPQEKKAVLDKLTPEEKKELLDKLTLEERLQGLPPEVIEQYLKKVKDDSSAAPSPDDNGADSK